MGDYTIPPIGNLPFDFGSGGYQIPEFDELNFSHGLRPVYSQTSDLRSAISVMQLYQDTTYTYTKACRTIVTGYGTNGIQTLQLPCEYAGIRDIGGYIYGNPPHADLGSSISVLRNFADLLSYTRAATKDSKDLNNYLHVISKDYQDLVSAIRRLDKDTADLPASVGGWIGVELEKDLASSLYSIPPIDLQGILNVIEIRNLSSNIEGVWWKGQTNLGAQIPSTSVRNSTNLINILHGYAKLDLGGEVRAMMPFDLLSSVVGGTFNNPRDLSSYLNVVSPADLSSIISGWQTVNLKATISGGFGGGDLRSYISAVPYVDLLSKLKGWQARAVAKDLNSIVEGFYFRDLGGIIRSVTPADLGAYINSRGKSEELGASIIPMTIMMSTVFKVSLLEHKDLPVLINYGCAHSDYRDLKSITYAFMKHDLKSQIIGWFGDFADNVRDLKSYINVRDFSVTDKIDVTFAPPRVPMYTQIDVEVSAGSVYTALSELVIGFSNSDYATLVSAIHGHFNSANLTSYINAQVQSNFTTTPEWVSPKTTEVFINLRRFEERWSRFVDLMFTSITQGENYYFYVSGDEKIYKVDRAKKWVLWVTGYDKDYDSMIERRNVRRKFIFNLSKYTSMDEAIRDMMDRVVEYRQTDLSSTIAGEFGTHTNLTSSLNAVFTYRWSKNLLSAMKVLQTGTYDMPTDITPQLYKAQLELSSLIEGKSYEPPLADGIEFIFEDAEYTAPIMYNDMDWTWEQI